MAGTEGFANAKYRQNSGAQVISLPQIVDGEGDAVSVSVDLADVESFANFYAATNKLVLELDNSVPVGSYHFSVTLDDGVANSVYEVEVIVEPNHPPYFPAFEERHSFREQSGWKVIELPVPYDAEGDPVTIEVMRQDITPFALWN